ncbi:MAG: glutathione S-transferase family protein [Pseudomonadales bacterium]|jgi:glutathione S-transferase|nr:glutathione S-transferase [Acidiferrobacteraceae bacterium]MDP6375445.1 glutathione S-transferase family protein [Pseudomonadales bacterium]MDP6470650.1 glutathione S-transferase family protein [Pseudomonadales bacterium]MDP6828494.1 glutathione S-transferase family protein [Pseudomonadales bacterium]MDP6970521.1 glutathione S-transferase family protein [Pseudomonadales bacterium]|tara:strand:- start:2272 stop:2880 length:609 start_codon:yes stop_codon:yes gene_type:complete
MLKLHHAPNSRSGRIVWLLKELDMPFELNAMAFHPKDLKSDDHRARHPLGRVPVLEDGDVMIYESGAIMEYIMARYGDGGLKPAVDSPDFPAYLQWFHYSEGMVMPPINIIMVNTVLLPPDRRDENALNQAKRLLGKALAPINEALEGKEYLAGTFSAADIQLGHASIMSGRLGMIGDDMPNLAAYVERLQQRPACQEAFAA